MPRSLYDISDPNVGQYRSIISHLCRFRRKTEWNNLGASLNKLYSKQWHWSLFKLLGYSRGQNIGCNKNKKRFHAEHDEVQCIQWECGSFQLPEFTNAVQTDWMLTFGGSPNSKTNTDEWSVKIRESHRSKTKTSQRKDDWIQWVNYTINDHSFLTLSNLKFRKHESKQWFFIMFESDHSSM